MGRIEAIFRLQLFTVYFFFIKFFVFLQNLYRRLVKIDEIPEGKARLSSILYRQKRDIEEIAREIDFLTVHNSFVDTKLLEGNYWTLYSLTKDFAYFVLLPKPVTYYNSQRSPFVYVQLFDEALLLAEMSRKEFERFAGELAKNPQPETIYYTNTARCGSTLLAKMLHCEGKSHCTAEPYPIPNLSIGLDEGYFTREDVKTLLPHVITVLRKDVPVDQVFILKTECTGVRLVEFTDEIPNFRNLFSFRKNGIDSVERILKREEIGDLLTAIYLASPQLCNWIYGFLSGMEGKHYQRLKPDTDKKRSAIVYAAPYGTYLKNEERFLMPCVWFHDIIHNTEGLLREIFRNIGIPEDLAVEQAKWKGEDSQKGTFLSQEALRHIETPMMKENERNLMEEYATVLGVPLETLLSKEKDPIIEKNPKI
ncbi:unnamed protein product, partial [Mesorhabditis belari]|uniref:Sulfotransferase n=1 Tax=Mesorhabditis belari TaxID=2138241 RepID=A0AAF3EFC4_9BILA